MNRLCAAQNSSKSAVKKLPGEVEFPNNSLVTPFLQEPPMGLRRAVGTKRQHTDFNSKALSSSQGRPVVRPDQTQLWFCFLFETTKKLLPIRPLLRLSLLLFFSSVCVCEGVSECGRGVLLSWYVWARGNFRICPLHTPSPRTNARGKGLGNSIRNLSSMRQIQLP